MMRQKYKKNIAYSNIFKMRQNILILRKTKRKTSSFRLKQSKKSSLYGVFCFSKHFGNIFDKMECLIFLKSFTKKKYV